MWEVQQVPLSLSRQPFGSLVWEEGGGTGRESGDLLKAKWAWGRRRLVSSQEASELGAQ